MGLVLLPSQSGPGCQAQLERLSLRGPTKTRGNFAVPREGLARGRGPVSGRSEGVIPARGPSANDPDEPKPPSRGCDGDRRNSPVSILEIPQLVSFGPAV